ncbi:unnamed protein product [Tilletia controversa]|nr:unnamed protein product [Tilletia controversa]
MRVSIVGFLALCQIVAAATYTTTKCQTTSISGTSTRTTTLGATTSRSTTTKRVTPTITQTSTLPKSTVVRTSTTTVGTVTSGKASTAYATVATYGSTVTQTYTNTIFPLEVVTTTYTPVEASTTRVYTYTLDPPAPTLPSSQARGLAGRIVVDERDEVVYLNKRGKRVQCSAVTVFVSTTTQTAKTTATVVKTITPTSTVTRTSILTRPAATVTPAPVTSTSTVDQGVSTEFQGYTEITRTDTTETRTYTSTVYTSTATVTNSAYKACDPKATRAFGGFEIANVLNLTSRGQKETFLYEATEYNYQGNYMVDCCNQAAGTPGAVALMGVMVLGSLVLKRQRERPKRPWKIWSLDISKQMLGQLFVHTLNIVLSDAVAAHGRSNPCSLYFLNIAIDTTLGVFIIYITLRIVTHVLTSVLGWHGFVSGQYGNVPTPDGGSGKPKMSYWGKQLVTYLFAIFIMKIIVTGIMWMFPFFFALGRWLLSFFGKHRNVQVFFVMALFPLAMNVIQFWLIDSLLRHNPTTSVYAKLNNSGTIVDEFGDGGDRSDGEPGSHNWRGQGRRSYEEEEGSVSGGAASSRRRTGGGASTSAATLSSPSTSRAGAGTGEGSQSAGFDPYRAAEGNQYQSRANLMDNVDDDDGSMTPRSASGRRLNGRHTKLHMDDSEQRPASPASNHGSLNGSRQHSRENSGRR